MKTRRSNVSAKGPLPSGQDDTFSSDLIPKAATTIRNILKEMVREKKTHQIPEALTSILRSALPNAIQLQVFEKMKPLMKLRPGDVFVMKKTGEDIFSWKVHMHAKKEIIAALLRAKRPDLANAVAASDGSVPYLTYEVVLEMNQEVKVASITNRLSAALSSKKNFPEVVGMRIKEKSMRRDSPGKTRE